MKVVFIKELQSLIKDVRLFLFLAIVATVSIISGIISSFQYETIRSENDFLQQQYETELRERCGQSLHHTCIWLDHLAVQKTTNDLFIAGSESINYPNYAEIDINNLYFGDPDVYYPKKSLSTDISSLKFIRFDMSFLVEVIFSFLVLLLVYNVISREKESGTLRLILANHIPRDEILLGKIAACTLVVAITLAFGILIQLLVIIQLGKIPLDSAVFRKIPILYIIFTLYLLFWVLLSALMSVITRRSTISLTYLLILWVTLILIVPSFGRIIVSKAVGNLPSADELALQYRMIEQEMFSQGVGWRGGNVKANARDNHEKERKFAPIYQEYLEKLNRYQYRVAKQRVDHLKFLYDFGSLSPSFLFRRLSETLCGSGPPRQYRFLVSLQRYRRELMETFRKLDLKDAGSFHLAFIQNYMSWKPINPDLLPRFKEVFPSNIRLILENWWLIILFLSEILIAFLICHVTFLRFDPR